MAKADEIFRDFQRFTGDGLPNPPVNAPLPVGDPRSGVYNIEKAKLRQWSKYIEDLIGGAGGPFNAGNIVYGDGSVADVLDRVTGTVRNAALLQLQKMRMQAGQPVRISCFGDSITAGSGSGDSADYPAHLQVLLRDYYQNQNITLDNQGIGGNTSRDLLARYQGMAAFAPHVVLLMIGMNDTSSSQNITLEEYADNLTELLARMRDQGFAVLMADIPPRKRLNGDGWQWVDAYRQVCQAVADANGVQIIRMHDILLDLVSSENGYSWGDLSNDGMHYNSAVGYRQIAGAWLAFGLALEPLALKCGQEKDMLGGHVVKVGNAVLSYTLRENAADNSKEGATVRYTAADDASNLRIYLWVEHYKHCDAVLYLTRERNAGKAPQLVIGNLEIPASVSATFTLGQNAGAGVVGRAVSVPLRACRLCPGLNIINMRCSADGTAEFAKIAVHPVDPQNLNRAGVPRERFARGITPYSSSRNAYPLDFGTSPHAVVGDGVRSVRAGTRVFLGLLDGDPDYRGAGWMGRYRLRGRIQTGLVLELSGLLRPNAEQIPCAEFAFTTSGSSWQVEARARYDTGTFSHGSKSFAVGNLNADVKMEIVLSRSATELYFNDDAANPVVIPFALNLAALVARNGGSGNSVVFNPLIRLGTGVLHFNNEGESWLDFNAATRSIVVGGAVLTSSLTAT